MPHPLDGIAVEGKVIFINDESDILYRSKIAINPTWLQVCVIANDMIRVTDDHHHVYLEGIREVQGSNGQIYELIMGS